ncbi:hypothetical protein BJX66DRAFT_334486 [Aspergillus keveii]|uniref:Uncharacterized protein n=1 Tax=Aspergillus keveii TaxID=714993 RepID=A0ABR4GGG8_9EURO
MKDSRQPPRLRSEEEYFYSPISPQTAEWPRVPSSPELPHGLPTKESVGEIFEGTPHAHIPLRQYQQVDFIHMQTPEQIDQQLQQELEQASAYDFEEREILEDDEGEDEGPTREENEMIEDDPIPDQYQPQPQPQPYAGHQSIHDRDGFEFSPYMVTSAFSGFPSEMGDTVHTEELPLPQPMHNIHRQNHRRRRLRARRNHRYRRTRNATTTTPQAALYETTANNSRVNKFHPEFEPTIARLSRPLHPLVSITTGLTHPFFPKSMLAFNILTSSELNELAIHFHQTYPPTRETFRYPLPVKPWIATNGLVRDLGLDVEVKRRRFGKFIGLKGCESPTGPAETSSTTGSVVDRQAEIRAETERQWEKARGVAIWEQEKGCFELKMERERGRRRARMLRDTELESRPRARYY